MDNFPTEPFLDDLLTQLPSEPPAIDLGLRVCQAIQARRKRRARLHLALSAALALSGAWLAIPALVFWLQDLALPSSGLPVLADWLGIAVSGANTILANALSGFSALQSGFTPLGASAWPGLAILALSAMLALDYLIPRVDR